MAEPNPRWRHLGFVAALILVHAMYIYSAVTLQKDLLLADQMVWLREVLIPLDRGDMSLWEAVTWDYTVLNHGHIPTLITLVASERWFGLSHWPDVVVGYISLLGIIWIHRAHIARERLRHSRAVRLALSAMLFTAAPPPFWSLLQFQMFYIFQAVLLAYLFASSVKSGEMRAVLVSIPVLMLLGGPSVAATIAAMALVSCVLAARRVVTWAHPAGVIFTTAIAALTFHTFVNGPREHTTTTISDIWTDGARMVIWFVRSLGLSFGYLAPIDFVHPIVEDATRMLISALVVVAIVATIRAWMRSVDVADCFPIVLILSGLIWSAGVAASRVPELGTDALAVDRPLARYAPYLTATIAAGLIQFWARNGVWIAVFPRITFERAVLFVAATQIGFSALAVGVHLDRIETEAEARVVNLIAFANEEPNNFITSNKTCRFGDCPELVEYLVVNHLGTFRE